VRDFLMTAVAAKVAGDPWRRMAVALSDGERLATAQDDAMFAGHHDE
jgi:hypothetical protein